MNTGRLAVALGCGGLAAASLGLSAAALAATPATAANVVAAAPATAATRAAPAATLMGAAHPDPRLRSVLYSADEIYRLPGYVGYQIDLEFQAGERFVGLGAGDVKGLAFAAEANHLFIKPRAADVHTNLTVLTTRHAYHFDYATLPTAPGPEHADVVYVLRFLYPTARSDPRIRPARPPGATPPPAEAPGTLLAQAQSSRARNTDYRYCGRRELQPLAVWDDGVQTHLRFGPHSELPAVFVRNDDGSESLLNFHVEHGEVVVHRIARRFVLRRGGLTGCLVNKGFDGSAAALPTGTISPLVQRVTRESDHETADQH
ncbi:MAG: TrbG/VirB9 family P-type conjugative transfer protein [Steroidobacteraceae bacterium]